MNISRLGNECLHISRYWYPAGDTAASILGSQSVRWKKPRWIPRSKSKEFFVPKRCKIPEEEVIELTRLFNKYRTEMKSVRLHLERENRRTSATSELASQQAAEEEEEHLRLMEYNIQENKRIAALREKRLQEQYETDLARVIASKEKMEKLELAEEQEALRIIAETQELVKTFIKREDLENAIEEAIENPKDYNFALDAEGQILKGQNSLSKDVQEDKEVLSSRQ
ncbi:ribosomal protein, S26 [Halocaridina rubra]|uniref:Small ribosomal subunit protein mS26 n=1 Tax=Halocaridina rubra TaxID=373956 RepID=A0AAN8WWT0_HALRR